MISNAPDNWTYNKKDNGSAGGDEEQFLCLVGARQAVLVHLKLKRNQLLLGASSELPLGALGDELYIISTLLQRFVLHL